MNEIAMPAQTVRRSPKTWLVIATVIAVPGVVVGAGLALMSAMLFDAPGSENNRALIVLALSLVAFPIACLVSIPCAWVAYAKRRFRGAVLFSLLPLLPVASAIVGIVWLQFGYGGKFGG